MFTILRNKTPVFSSDSNQVRVDLQKHFQSFDGDDIEINLEALDIAVQTLSSLAGFQFYLFLSEELKPLDNFVDAEFEAINSSGKPSDLKSPSYTIRFEGHRRLSTPTA